MLAIPPINHLAIIVFGVWVLLTALVLFAQERRAIAARAAEAAA
jgi:hypothetical protein